MFEQKQLSPGRKGKQQFIPRLLIVLGIIMAVVAILLLLHDHRTEPQPPAGAQQSLHAPSSKKPPQAAISSYTVAPDLPKYIEIPAIQVPKTRIMQLRLMKNNEIATPHNIYDTGWYDDSAKPGQNGAMFIYGHVSNWKADGVFYNLKKLQPGDTVTITRGDNKMYTYKVVSSKIYLHDKVDMSQVLLPIDPNKPGLNLMTCTGQVIKGTSEFSERLVVFTSLASS